MLKKIIAIGVIATLTYGVYAHAAEATQKSAESAIAEAQAAQKAAAEVKGEWRDTGDMLKNAEDALAEKKYDEAVKMAEQAKFQYEAGTAQMEAEKGVGNPDTVK